MVKSLYEKNQGFGWDDGWVRDIWTWEEIVDGKLTLHKVWYIKHSVTKHIITSQHKAYMDTIRMLMYIELVVAEYMKDAHLD